jgi:hypothetical protein
MTELNGCGRSLLSSKTTYDPLFVATHDSTIWLHSCQQLTIAIELIFPVAVDGGQPARRTTESEIQPSDVFAFIVQRDSNGHLECFIPARTATFAEVGLFEILVAVADWMFEFTRFTYSAGSTFVVVKKDFEKTPSTFADGIRKVLRDVAVFQAVAQDLSLDVFLTITVLVLSAFLQRHCRASTAEQLILGTIDRETIAKMARVNLLMP